MMEVKDGGITTVILNLTFSTLASHKLNHSHSTKASIVGIISMSLGLVTFVISHLTGIGILMPLHSLMTF